MSLPGVGLFSGENTSLLVSELRKEGFPVRALWSSSRKEANLLKQKLKVDCATTCIRELVLRTDVDLGKLSQLLKGKAPLILYQMSILCGVGSSADFSSESFLLPRVRAVWIPDSGTTIAARRTV